MNAIETTIIKLPVSDAAIEYAERYCGFYDNAKYSVIDGFIIITHQFTIDPTQSIFWPGNQIS